MNVERVEQARSLLLKALGACDIRASQDDVQLALRDAEHGPLLVEWACLHLGSDTLLTANELQIYTALDQAGRVDQLADSHDLAEVQAIMEDELRQATEELNRSTEKINKQTETLHRQRDAMSRLVQSEANNAAGRAALEVAQRKKIEVERNQLMKEIERLSQDVNLRLQAPEPEQSALADSVAEILQSDDKLLSSLQKLGRELRQPSYEGTQEVEKLRDLSLRLATTTVETVQCRLNTIYLEALSESEKSSMAESVLDREASELQEEVESLYSELLPVAQMSANQQHTEPSIKSFAAQSEQAMNRTTLLLNYTDECLDFLLDRMARIRHHVGSQKSYQASSAAILALLEDELDAVRDVSGTTPAPAYSASPARLPNNTHAKRTFGKQEKPLDALLQHLAISLPEEEGARQHGASLNKTLQERQQKCSDISKGIQESFERAIQEQVQDARRAIQLLKDSFLSESPFGAVKLVDTEIEESVLLLGQEVDRAMDALRILEGQAVAARSRKRDDLTQRWGSQQC